MDYEFDIRLHPWQTSKEDLTMPQLFVALYYGRQSVRRVHDPQRWRDFKDVWIGVGNMLSERTLAASREDYEKAHDLVSRMRFSSIQNKLYDVSNPADGGWQRLGIDITTPEAIVWERWGVW